jgi:hypothetical protein
MRHRQCRRMGRSLTPRHLVLGPVDRVLRRLRVAAVAVEAMHPAAPRLGVPLPVVPRRVDLGLVAMHLAHRLALLRLVPRRVDLGLVAMHLAHRLALLRPVPRRADLAPADTARANRPVPHRVVALVDRVDLTSLADRVNPVRTMSSGVDLANPVNPVNPVRTSPVDLANPAVPGRTVDRHRRHPRRTSNTASTSGVARSGVAPGTHRTDSARPTMAHRHLRRNAASAGTTGLRPEDRRLTGMAHRLLAAGTDRRLPVAGTATGTDRRVTSLTRRNVSGRSPTAASARYRCSTRSSVDGDSGSSATGYRCTDLTHDWPPVFNALTAKTGGQSSFRRSEKQLRSGAARSEKNAYIAFPLQDVRRG